MTESVSIQKIAWSLRDISEMTGLSIGFLRNEVRAARLKVKRFGRRVLVLDEELRRYLNHSGEEADSHASQIAQSCSSLACLTPRYASNITKPLTLKPYVCMVRFRGRLSTLIPTVELVISLIRHLPNRVFRIRVLP